MSAGTVNEKRQMGRIYTKGQLTLPKALREQVGFQPGDTVVMESEGDHIIVRKPRGLLEFRNFGATPRNPMPWSEMRRVAWDDHVARKHGKKTSDC